MMPDIQYCPGTLAAGHSSYSRTCLSRVFGGHKVSHILPFSLQSVYEPRSTVYLQNIQRVSISGVQVKLSAVLDKYKLRLTNEGEQGMYILKPIPTIGNNADQMPANEHLTMQIARQVYGIETAENALIFFDDGMPAYITKRFDVYDDGAKRAQDDFASLAGRTPQTHGENYKYTGNYLELFELMKRYLPAYQTEAPKLFKLILFNYLFSNGDAHFKNFSIVETPLGDYKLSPAYDLLNSRIHINDSDFALQDGLLPKNRAEGKIADQFRTLALAAGLTDRQTKKIMDEMLSKSADVALLVNASFLKERLQRNYWQAYQTRQNRLLKV